MNASFNAIVDAETSRLAAARASAIAGVAVAEAVPKHHHRATKVAKAKAHLDRIDTDVALLAELRTKVATASADATFVDICDALPVTSDYYNAVEDHVAFSESLNPAHTPTVADAVFEAMRAYAPELDGFWVVYRALSTDQAMGAERLLAFIRKRVEGVTRKKSCQDQRLRTIYEFLRLLGYNMMDAFRPAHPIYLMFLCLANTVEDKKTPRQTAREYVGAHLMNLPLKTYNKYKRDVADDDAE